MLTESRSSIPSELFTILKGWSREDVHAFYVKVMAEKMAEIVPLN